MLHGDAAVVDAGARPQLRAPGPATSRGWAIAARRPTPSGVRAEYLAAELAIARPGAGVRRSFAEIRSFGARLLLHIGVAAFGAALLWTLPALGAMLGGARSPP